MVLKNLLLNTVVAAEVVPSYLRPRLMRLVGVDVDAGSTVHAGCTFEPGLVRLGRGVFVNRGVSFDPGSASITLADGVVVGQGVVFAAAGHEVGGPERRAVGNVAADIAVGTGTWIGARVVVLSGVSIASGCVVGAGAVVTRDTAPNGVYAGVPATRVRDLAPGDVVAPAA